MEHRKVITDFSNLINEVYFQNVLSYLSLKDLLKLRITSKQIKEVVSTYMGEKRPPFLVLPPDVEYTEETIENLTENIEKACSYFGAEPPKCNMRLNCMVFSDSLDPRSIEIKPPLHALRAIGRSGVKTELLIVFNLVNMTSFKQNIHILEQIIEYLPHTQSIYIVFSNNRQYSEDGGWVEDAGWITGTWFDTTIDALINLEHLSSLRILGDAPWEHILKCLPLLRQLTKLKITGNRNLEGDELLGCLSRMTQLRSLGIKRIEQVRMNALTDCLKLIPKLDSLSISDFEIEGIDKDIGLMLEDALPNLFYLKLKKIKFRRGDISSLLFHIRNLLSKLTSLNLSDNNISPIMLGWIFDGINGYISNLKSLNLSKNYICVSNRIGRLMALSGIMKFFEPLTKLEELDLADNNITSNCIAWLLTTLKTLRLRKLDLSGNILSIPALSGILKMLPKLQIIKVERIPLTYFWEEEQDRYIEIDEDEDEDKKTGMEEVD
jgi:Leucine-rich repeat (LRR) protein